MPQFAANLTMLFTELPFMQRFEAAAKAGFEAVEYLFPYAFDKKELAAALRTNGLQQVLHNLPAGDWDAGERGIACHPGPGRRVPRGRRRGDRLRDRARLPAGQLPGRQDAGGRGAARRPRDAGRQPALRRAASCRPRASGSLIEPINSFDIPGFFLTRTDQALALIDEVGSPNLKVQYDIYHAQRMEGELGATLSKHIGAHRPHPAGRQPGPRRAGHRRDQLRLAVRAHRRGRLHGWIGCEYKPRGTHRRGPRLARSLHLQLTERRHKELNT